MPDLYRKPYSLMTDTELREEAYSRIGGGIPPVARYDAGLMSFAEREKVVSYLRANDDWNSAFGTFLNRSRR